MSHRTPSARRSPRPSFGARGLALLSLTLLSACGADAAGPSPAPGSAPARRIVPASATAVDFVDALVDPARVAGFPEQALEYSTLHDRRALYAEHPSFDAWIAEPVLLLEPDLVVVDPWQSPETNARLREAGVRIIVLPEIHDWPGARRALRDLADELDARERAEALIAELEGRIAALARSPGARAGLKVLCYSNFGSTGMTAGSRTTIHEMLSLAGLVNLAAESGRRGHVNLSFEELLLLDPDLILVSRPLEQGEGPAGDRGGASERLLLSEPNLSGLRAVRERRIVRLPAWLYATGSHELVRGAETLAAEVDALLARLAETSAGTSTATPAEPEGVDGR